MIVSFVYFFVGKNKSGPDRRRTCLTILFYLFILDTNAALHFYRNENARTEDGVLKIYTERKENAYRAFNEKTKKFYNDKKYVQSAMLQSWNKFCFTGGIVEFSAKLPGSPRIGGLWPACEYNHAIM